MLGARNIVMPKVFVTKGLNLPIDCGASFGMAREIPAQFLGFHSQWTIFQNLTWPAIALRGSFSRTQLELAQISTGHAEIATSFSFLRYFTVSGLFGKEASSARLSREKAAQEFGIQQISTSELEYRDWIKNTATIGFGVLIFPPFVSIDTEINQVQNQRHTIQTKLSIGL